MSAGAGAERGDESTSQRVRKTVSKPPGAGERRETEPPSQPSEGTHPADAWVVDTWPPELQESRPVV